MAGSAGRQHLNRCRQRCHKHLHVTSALGDAQLFAFVALGMTALSVMARGRYCKVVPACGGGGGVRREGGWGASRQFKGGSSGSDSASGCLSSLRGCIQLLPGRHRVDGLPDARTLHSWQGAARCSRQEGEQNNEVKVEAPPAVAGGPARRQS